MVPIKFSRITSILSYYPKKSKPKATAKNLDMVRLS